MNYCIVGIKSYCLSLAKNIAVGRSAPWCHSTDGLGVTQLCQSLRSYENLLLMPVRSALPLWLKSNSLAQKEFCENHMDLLLIGHKNVL